MVIYSQYFPQHFHRTKFLHKQIKLKYVSTQIILGNNFNRQLCISKLFSVVFMQHPLLNIFCGERWRTNACIIFKCLTAIHSTHTTSAGLI